jgi:exopolysaccharide biosynthesis protein
LKIKKLKKRKVILIIIGAFIAVLLFLFYGPFKGFRVMWINTAMHTSSSEWLAEVLYSDDYIQKVLRENSVYSTELTDTSLVKIQGDDVVEFKTINTNTYKGYLITVSDPSKIDLAVSDNPEGLLLEEILKKNTATVGINAGGYTSSTLRGTPDGITISGGEIVSKCDGNEHILGGMSKENVLVTGEFADNSWKEVNFRWAVEFGPALIINGVKSEVTKYSGGIAPRSAIGQIFLFMVLMARMRKFMQRQDQYRLMMKSTHFNVKYLKMAPQRLQVI